MVMLIDGLSLLALGILLVVGLIILFIIIGTLIGVLIAFFPAVIVAVIIWFLTGSLLWGGVAFVVLAIIMAVLKR